MNSLEQQKKNEVDSWHRLRAKVYKDAWIERNQLNTYLQENPEKWKYEVETCRTNIQHFINYHCWTYDPRNVELDLPTTVPFWLTPKQNEYIDFLQWHYENGKNAGTEKTRGEGMSWLWVLFALNKWLFVDGFKAGFGSYKEDKVDQLGNMDSLFEKFRFAYYRLDKELRPDKFRTGRHDNYKRIWNPETSATIVGEVGQNIGRGGRNSMYFIDEHAHLDHADAVEKSLSENTNCIIYGSTAFGSNNVFFTKIHTMPKRSVFTFHWRDNPMKNEDWYADRKLRFDSVTIAQEIDIDYYASVEGILIPANWVNSAVNYQFDQTSNIRHCGVDVGGGSEKGESVYVDRIGNKVNELIPKSGVEPTDWALECANTARNNMVQVFKYDAIGVGAGIQGSISKMEPEPEFQTIPIISGDSPTDKIYDDNTELTASDRFANLRAEMWWNLREYFRKTHEHKQGKGNYQSDDLISIPNDRDLITQLSQPTISYNSRGKIKIESKQDMLERGVKSPDRADALVYCFADMQPKFKQIPAGSR